MATSSNNAAQRQLNEIVRTDGKSSPKGQDGIAERYASNFHRDGNSYRSARFPEKIEFVDRKDRMHIYGKASDFTVRAMVETAKERGWESLEVRGRNPVFKSMVFVEATVRGIPVTGHQASAKDLEAIERRQVREAARANPVVQAFVNANTAKARDAAIKAHPELKEAFAAQAIAMSAIKQSGADAKDQQDLQDRVNDKIARAIHQGKPMPTMEVRTQHQLVEQSNDQERD